MDTQALLKELEELVMDSADVPFVGRKAVKTEEVLRLIDEINHSLPAELATAQSIVADEERRKLEGQKEAERIVAQAKDYIAQITEESELVKMAQERANEIVAAAEESARNMNTNALTYATDVLKYVEDNMEHTLDSLKQNRESLMQQNTEPTATVPENHQ